MRRGRFVFDCSSCFCIYHSFHFQEFLSSVASSNGNVKRRTKSVMSVDGPFADRVKTKNSKTTNLNVFKRIYCKTEKKSFRQLTKCDLDIIHGRWRLLSEVEREVCSFLSIVVL